MSVLNSNLFPKPVRVCPYESDIEIASGTQHTLFSINIPALTAYQFCSASAFSIESADSTALRVARISTYVGDSEPPTYLKWNSTVSRVTTPPDNIEIVISGFLYNISSTDVLVTFKVYAQPVVGGTLCNISSVYPVFLFFEVPVSGFKIV